MGGCSLVVRLDVHFRNQLVVVLGGQVVGGEGDAEGGHDEEGPAGGAHGPGGVEVEAGEEARVVVEDVGL